MKYIKSGEYAFNDVERVYINKYLIDNLYASAIYSYNNKMILEIIAPKNIMTNCHDELIDDNIPNGERWSNNIKSLMSEQWPLTHANYYLEINGEKIGDDDINSTNYRYEPDLLDDNTINENHNSSGIDILEKAIDNKTIQNEGDVPDVPNSSISDSIKSIIDDEDLTNVIVSTISSIPEIDPEMTAEEEELHYLEYLEKQNCIEKEFFADYRKHMQLPDYYKDKTILIADLSFRCLSNIDLTSNLNISFIIKSYSKHSLTRIKLELPYKEHFDEPLKIHSKQSTDLLDKIAIEGIVDYKNDDDIKIPTGKKPVYIVYETIDDLMVTPIFYVKDILEAPDPSLYVFDRTELLQEKSRKGFNRYVTFAGYTDINNDIVDLELFQMIARINCDKKINLI